MRKVEEHRSLLLTAVGAALATALLLSAAQGPMGCFGERSGVSRVTAEGRPPAVLLPSPALALAGGKAAPRAVSLAGVAERALPSVVNISSTKVVRHPGARYLMPFGANPFFREFFGEQLHRFRMPKEHREKSLGSGVIVSADGVVLTNYHVVAHASKITVTTHDKREYGAKIVGKDPKSDLAVIRLQGKVSGLRPLPFGDSGKLRLGDFVLAIGNPFGVGQTVTMGIVSAKGRANVGIVDYEDFIQTDAAINPGNSGGALVDMNGRLVGINTAILSRSGGYQGIGFAIPSNMARPIMRSLLKTGKVVRGFLGVSIQDLTPALARGMGLGNVRGVLVSDVQPKSPADRAGLRRGDVIQRVNGERVRSSARLRNIIAAQGAGAKVSIALLRGGKRITLSAQLGTLKQAARLSARIRPREGALGGMEVGALSEEARRAYRIPRRIRDGVVVKKVTPFTPAAMSGLRRGDVIMQVNRRDVRSVKEFLDLYKKARHNVVLLVSRRGSTFYLVISR